MRAHDIAPSYTDPIPVSWHSLENSSYALVSSLLSKVKGTVASASTSIPVTPLSPSVSNNAREPTKLPPPKPVHPRVQNVRERPTAALAAIRCPAPPLISMTPAISELLLYLYESDTPNLKVTSSRTFQSLTMRRPLAFLVLRYRATREAYELPIV